MLTFVINLYCPKPYHRRDNSICIIKIMNKPNIFIETRTQSFCYRDLSSCVYTLQYICSLHRALVFTLRATEIISVGNRAQDMFSGLRLCSCSLAETGNVVIGPVLLPCLVFALQKTSLMGVEARHIFFFSRVLSFLCSRHGLKE